MKKLISIICAFTTLLMVPALNLSGQNQVQVRGKVTDNAGVPVIGAGIVQSNNKSLGTTTDIDGNYVISVPSNATLVVSCIGYKTVSVPVSGKSVVNVILEEDSQFLEETVVIGYGVQRKSAYLFFLLWLKFFRVVSVVFTPVTASQLCRGSQFLHSYIWDVWFGQ